MLVIAPDVGEDHFSRTPGRTVTADLTSCFTGALRLEGCSPLCAGVDSPKIASAASAVESLFDIPESIVIADSEGQFPTVIVTFHGRLSSL